MVPLVTVCIPTFNGIRHIRDCMDSVLGQSCADLEVLIVDDCSSDGTRSVVQEYASSDSRVRVFVNQENLGLVPNWNGWGDLVKGTWLKLVFQDEVIELNCIRGMLKA